LVSSPDGSPQPHLSDRAKAQRLKDVFGEGGFDYVGRAAARNSVRMIARERLDGHGSPTAETKSVTLDRQAAFLRSKIGGLRGVSIRSRSAQLLRHSSPFGSRHPESKLSRILSISTPTENTRPRRTGRWTPGRCPPAFALAAAAIS
jgi:hypothetical protein